MNEQLGSVVSPEQVNIMATVFEQDDISRLTPASLVDYHFAVTALQHEGQEVFLSTIAHDMAFEAVERTHHGLLVASGDALTKEMTPGGLGGTTGGDDISHEASVVAALSELQKSGKYEAYVPNDYRIGVYDEGSMNKELFGMIFAMRSKLIEMRDDRVAAMDVVQDVASLARVYFGEQRRLDVEAGRPTPERGWLEFAGYLQEYIAELHNGQGPMTMVQANRLINAVHEGVDSNGNQRPMVMRFTDLRKRGDKARRYVEALDATHGSYEDLLVHAGYLGGLLFSYVTGKQKSLTRLRSDRPVPAAFTHLG